ncbi:MAG: helix-turn-helix domain-containing protein [Tannerella sp.]|nr:helix-turn-helix domain-containing protein [Tannerella sp.]
MAVGDTIKKLRMAKKISQQYVADSLNVDRRTYAAWEDGTQSIKSSHIPFLAEFFGVEISDLYKEGTKINIKQSFKDSAGPINSAILILTDKEAINRKKLQSLQAA